MESISEQNRNQIDHWLKAYVTERSDQAFGELVQFYSGMVYSSALRRSSDAHLSEEITQDVFALLARKAPQLLDHPSLTGWIHTTTRWVTHDRMKKEKRKRLEIETLHSNESNEELSFLDDSHALLDEALDSLKPAVPPLQILAQLE